MSETKTSVWQSLMDYAYEKRADNKHEFMASLQGVERAAVLLGNLNYQVENGGIQQFVDNGYGCYVQQLLGVLADIGTPSCLELAKRVREFTKCWMKKGSTDRGFLGDYWNIRNDNEEQWESMLVMADEFDEFFYESSFHDRFMADVEAFLTGLVK